MVSIFTDFVHDPLYTFDPDNPEHSMNSFSYNPVFSCGILPKGQYRIVKEFTIPDDSPRGGYLEKIFVTAEFTVEETLES